MSQQPKKTDLDGPYEILANTGIPETISNRFTPVNDMANDSKNGSSTKISANDSTQTDNMPKICDPITAKSSTEALDSTTDTTHTPKVPFTSIPENVTCMFP